MTTTVNCHWGLNDSMDVFHIGRFLHFEVNQGGGVASVALTMDDVLKVKAEIDAYFAANKQPVVKHSPKGYSALSDQAKTIFQHVKKAGSISAREAMADHGITSATLARRICDIEEAGFEVVRDRRQHPLTGKRYTRYTITA